MSCESYLEVCEACKGTGVNAMAGVYFAERKKQIELHMANGEREEYAVKMTEHALGAKPELGTACPVCRGRCKVPTFIGLAVLELMLWHESDKENGGGV